MVYSYCDSNPYYIRRREPSILDGFSLRPLPYPVLLILLVVCVFLGMKFTSSYEEVVETTESQVNWLLLATPLILIFAVKLLSSVEGRGGYSKYDGRKMGYCSGAGRGGGGGGGGASPWGVAALIVLLLILVQFQFSLFG
ncbi:uncharacterized protein LOC141639174 [Silene latifolia]|uniref:uncharacterized protein LOC141639174 n=1 Tax=Silene latifolia TaxID=37657 RepID=UPI003D76B827